MLRRLSRLILLWTLVSLPIPCLAAVDTLLVTPAGAAFERWNVTVDGDWPTLPALGKSRDVARDVVISPSGDVFAAGSIVVNTAGSANRDFYLLKVQTDGSNLQQFQADGGEALADTAMAVTLDGNGNVIASGRLRTLSEANGPPFGTNRDFAVVKLDANLNPVWTPNFFRRDGSGTEPDAASELATAVAVDSNNDIVAAGYSWEAGTDRDLLVCKINGATGTELWCTTVDGTETTETVVDEAAAIVVDSNDDVIVAGRLENLGESADFVVIKFDGTTGAEIWRVIEVGGAAGGFDAAQALAIDANDDLYAAGFFLNSTTSFDIGVVKILASGGTPVGIPPTGSSQWRSDIDDPASVPPLAPLWETDSASAIAIDPLTGDVMVGGRLDSVANTSDMAVARLDAVSGSTVWLGIADGTLRTVDPRHPPGLNTIAFLESFIDGVADLAVDPSGDVIAVGILENEYPATPAVFVIPALGIDATADVDPILEEIAITGHGLPDGEGPMRIRLDSGALPGGLAELTTYFVRGTGADSLSLHTTEADALAGLNPVDLSTATGTFSLMRMDLSKSDFSIVRFAGNGDGQGGAVEVWRADWMGTNDQVSRPFQVEDEAHAIAIDPEGNVVAVGRLSRPDIGLNNQDTDLAVIEVPEPAATAAALAAAGALIGLSALRQRRAHTRRR